MSVQIIPKIIILAYNREEELLHQLLLADKINIKVDVEIYDDNSTLGCNKILNKNFQNLNVKCFINKENKGYALNLLSALDSTDAEYVILMSDDDELLLNNINKLSELISKFSPDFVCPASYVSGRLYRGSRSIQDIRIIDFMFSASRMPGLVFRVKSVRIYLRDVIMLCDRGCEFSRMYPQVVLLMLLMNDGGKCIYFPHEIERLGFNVASGLVSNNGRSFWHCESRVYQLNDLCKIINSKIRLELREAMIESAVGSYIGRLFGSLDHLSRLKILISLIKLVVWSQMMRVFPAQVKEVVKKLIR